MTYKKTASLFALSLLTACGTNPTDTTTSTTSALVGDQNGQGDDNDLGNGHGDRDIKHVLLISVDGMHQSDLDLYVANHPSSTFAKLTHGSEYTNASAS